MNAEPEKQPSRVADELEAHEAFEADHSDSLYGALVASSQDSIKILDLEGHLLSMNESGQHLMEIDEMRQWLGKPWIEFWADEHRRDVELALEKARSGETGRFEGFRTTAKGKPKWWDVVVTPVVDDDGTPRRLLAIARDVTDRKRAEDAVRCVAEASFVVTESLGYERTIANVADVLVPALADWCVIDVLQDDDSLLAASILHSDPDKVGLAKEMRRQFPPLADRPIGSPAVVRTGEPQLISVISEEMMKESTQSEEHFHMIRSLGLRSYAAVPLKARGRTLGAMTIVSAESDRIFTDSDLPLFEELGRICGLAIDNARLYKAARSELKERRRAEAKLRELNETLELRVSERTEALETANTNLRKEVRDRKRAEKHLEEANRQLTLRNRELQEFAYAASHDLQEPLRKISSFVDLILTDFEKELPELGRQYLDRVQHAAIRMSQLIRDLLAYSRVETRKLPTSPVDLNRLVEEVLVDLEVPIKESKATIERSDLPVIQADASQMRQLFQNLISNALKFRREDEPLRVTISADMQAPSDGESYWEISVQDNGIGFDQQYSNRIFAPFQRLHERDEYPGTGMGLAICRRIVERHDGAIHASAQQGDGATFTVMLPSADE